LITKNQLCQVICNNHKIQTERFEIDIADITTSSKLAVALEYLGVLEKNKPLADYASERDGIIIHGMDEDKNICFLTLRDILKVLPE